jgi:hypothetical protein
MTIGPGAQPFRSLDDCFRAGFVRCFAAVLLCMASLMPSARCAEPPAEPRVSDQLAAKAPDSITGNPAAENEFPGTGLAGRLLSKREFVRSIAKCRASHPTRARQIEPMQMNL